MNIANLKKLSLYLESLPRDYKHFDMEVFYKDESPEFLMSYYGFNECGAAACAIGHIPLAFGMCDKEVRRGYHSWYDLAEYVLGIMEEPEFEWMFGSDWAKVDNSAKVAAHRINKFIDLGYPPVGFETDEGYNYSKELY